MFVSTRPSVLSDTNYRSDSQLMSTKNDTIKTRYNAVIVPAIAARSNKEAALIRELDPLPFLIASGFCERKFMTEPPKNKMLNASTVVPKTRTGCKMLVMTCDSLWPMTCVDLLAPGLGLNPQTAYEGCIEGGGLAKALEAGKRSSLSCTRLEVSRDPGLANSERWTRCTPACSCRSVQVGRLLLPLCDSDEQLTRALRH